MALSIARMCDTLGHGILLVIIPLYVVKLPALGFDLPETVLVGILLSLYGFTYTLFQPLTGALSDRLPRRKHIIVGGLVLTGICSLIYTVARHFVDLILLRMLQGIAAALAFPATMALIATATDKRTRGGSIGIFTTMRMTGLGIGPLIGGFIQVNFGFDAAFIAAGAFVLLSVVLVFMWVDELPGDVSKESSLPFRIFDRKTFDAGIVWLAFATLLMNNAHNIVNPLENEFNARLNQTALGFGAAMSAFVIGNLLFQVPIGWLSDRIGRKPVIISGLIVMGLATALLGEVRSTLQFTCLRLLQGVAAAATSSPILTLTADSSSIGSEGRRLSIVNTGFGIGMMTGPLFAGGLAVFFFQLPFFVGGLLVLLSAWIVYKYVPETMHRKATGIIGSAKTP